MQNASAAGNPKFLLHLSGNCAIIDKIMKKSILHFAFCILHVSKERK